VSERPAPPVRPAVRVTIGQIQVSRDPGANRVAVADVMDIAAGVSADLVVLPEYAAVYYPSGVRRDLAEPLDGPFVRLLREHAARTGVAAIAGLVIPAEHDESRAVNVVVAVDGAGNLAGVYRKVHLYDAFGHRESDWLEPGPPDAPPVVLPVAGLRFGVMTCYDLRFPESARRLVDAGANALVVPAAWVAGPLKDAQWRALAVARAIENTSVVVAVGMTGKGVVGRSLVVGPDGVVGLELDDKPAVRTVDLDPVRLGEVREANPSLANRRYRVVPA